LFDGIELRMYLSPMFGKLDNLLQCIVQCGMGLIVQEHSNRTKGGHHNVNGAFPFGSGKYQGTVSRDEGGS